MWADQISSTDDPALSINGTSVKKEISGYIVESQESEPEKPQDAAETLTFEPVIFPVALVAESPDIPDEEHVQLDVPAPVTAIEEGPLPPSEPVDNVENSNVAPIVPATPVQFPTAASEILEPEISRNDSPPGFSTPAVTFGVNINSPPSRTGTPDPEAEPKRKRISSQNFQRLARRISLNPRRQNSVSSMLPNIPGFKRNDSPRVSTDDSNARAEGSTSNNSPAGSIKGDEKGKAKKKDKKDKKAAT